MKSKEKSVKQPEPVVVQPVPSTRQQKLQDFLRKVQDKVVTLIDSNDVVIPKQKIPFSESQKEQNKQISVKLKLVQQTREKMKSRLQVIAEQQQKLKWEQRKNELIQSRQKTLSPLTIKTKSQLSRDDIKLLKKLKQEQKEFQHSLQTKTAEYNKKMEEMKKEEEMLKEKQMKEQVEARRRDIAQRLQLLQKQKMERQKQFEEEKRRMVEVKAKKKLFEEMQYKQKELQRIQMQKKINTFQSRVKNQQIDLHALREHEEKYRELKAQKDMERMKRKEEMSQLAKEKVVQFEKSKFHTIVINETRRRREEELEQRQHKLQMIKAARDYAQNVKRQYAPRLKTHSSSEEKSKQKVQGLSFEETKDIGNSYFEQMKMKIKQKKQENKDSSITVSNDNKSSQPQKTFSTKYRDYLSERRQFKEKRGDDRMNRTGDPRIKDKFIRKQLQEVCKQAGSLDKNEGLQKLKAFAAKLETERGKEDHLLLDKITAKLRILQSLSNN